MPIIKQGRLAEDLLLPLNQSIDLIEYARMSPQQNDDMLAQQIYPDTLFLKTLTFNHGGKTVTVRVPPSEGRFASSSEGDYKRRLIPSSRLPLRGIEGFSAQDSLIFRGEIHTGFGTILVVLGPYFSVDHAGHPRRRKIYPLHYTVEAYYGVEVVEKIKCCPTCHQSMAVVMTKEIK